MSEIAVLAKITTKPGQRSTVVGLFDDMMQQAESEPGTLAYRLHEDLGDEDVLWFFERYADKAALDAHSGSDVMKATGGKLADHLAGRPEIIPLNPIAQIPES